MPIIYKFSIKASPLHGVGLFAQQDIPKGTVWWTADENVKGNKAQGNFSLPNLIWNKDTIHELTDSNTPEKIAQILQPTMYYQEADLLIHFRDGAGYLNHSLDYNSQCIYNEQKDYYKLHSIAVRDIKAGEQITQNYNNYSKAKKNWVEDLFRKYLPCRIEFEKTSQFKSSSI